MIYSCKDVTLQNRKFSEFIDIDNEELLPGSVDNDTIYLSGYVEGDENNQNIKIKVSQLAEKVATDTGLVTNITEGVLETVTIGTITEKVKETVAEYINGTEEGGPSEVEKIIDEKIDEKTSESLKNYYTKTDIDDKNFISSTEYATTNKAGLVKLKTPATTFSLRTVSADETDTSAPSVYAADDVDAELSKLEESLGEAINKISDKVSKTDAAHIELEKDVNNLKELEINKKLEDHLGLINENKGRIADIKKEIGPSTDDDKNTLWDSINSLEVQVNNIPINCAEELKKATDTFDGKITRLDAKLSLLDDVVHIDEIPRLEKRISDIDTKIGKPSDDEINEDIWSKIRSLEGEIDSNTGRIATCEGTDNNILGIAQEALAATTGYKDKIESLETTVSEINLSYVSKEKLDEKNFVNLETLNQRLSDTKSKLEDYSEDYINEQIGSFNIDGLKENVALISNNCQDLDRRITEVSLHANNAFSYSEEAKGDARTAKATAEGFESRIKPLEDLNIAGVIIRLDEKNVSQDRLIEEVKETVDEAVGVIDTFNGRVQNLESELGEDGVIKTTLREHSERINDLEVLVGEGPIRISNIAHIDVPETPTVVAHINNINEVIDALREDVDDHHKILGSHAQCLDDITNTIGVYYSEQIGNEGEPVKQLCENAEDVLKRTDIANWPDKFSKIKDLWSGLYYICDIVGFDHYNEYLPAEPDKRNVITELSGLSGQISVNTNDIKALNERLDLFEFATGSAELNYAGIVSIISSVNDKDYVGGNVNIADPGTTAVSIDYFEKHKPAPFVEGGEEENQYRKKGTVYVQYKNQDDNNEQPIVYSKDAIDAKLEEEYASKDSGLIYNNDNDNKTFSLGGNNIQDSIDDVPIPMKCPAMCVTRQGIYVTVFYGEDGVAEPQDNNRGWRWVMLGTVPQEFVASDASGPATRG